jgi:hypothetical protein
MRCDELLKMSDHKPSGGAKRVAAGGFGSACGSAFAALPPASRLTAAESGLSLGSSTSVLLDGLLLFES